MSWSQIKDTRRQMSKLLCHDGRSAKQMRQGSNTNNQKKSKEGTYIEERFTI